MSVSCLKISAFLAVFLIGASNVSAGEKATVIQKNDSMNGFTLHSFKGFEKNWKLLTVRFRRDSGEMRFVYANKIAFSAIQKKQTHPYPNGSVLAKIGFKTEQDPSFPSSVVPTDSRRYQFMVAIF